MSLLGIVHKGSTVTLFRTCHAYMSYDEFLHNMDDTFECAMLFRELQHRVYRQVLLFVMLTFDALDVIAHVILYH